MKAPETNNRLQRRIDIILTALFLVFIFAMGIMTLVTDFEGVYKSGISKTRLSRYLTDTWEESSLWDQTAARIRSMDDYLSANIYGATELGYMNSSFQYALGKRMVNTGASQMLTTSTGHLFDLQNYVSMDTAAAKIQEMKNTVGDIPFLFVYEHPTIYAEGQVPAGYDVLDYSDEIAAELVEKIGGSGIPMLDSRDILPATGLDMADYLMYTDQHWATRASLEMAKVIAETTGEMTGTSLQPEKLDIGNFETETFEKLFLGKYGQRIGPGNIDPDDITIYWPKYDTSITRETYYLGETTKITAPFKESVIRWKYLEPDEGKTWNIKAYQDYGLTENHDIFTNPDAADCTILLLKDSYSASIGCFLSLVADEVYSVDLRRSDMTLAEWVQESNPDIVIVSYSMQMLRDDAYEFM